MELLSKTSLCPECSQNSPFFRKLIEEGFDSHGDTDIPRTPRATLCQAWKTHGNIDIRTFIRKMWFLISGWLSQTIPVPYSKSRAVIQPHVRAFFSIYVLFKLWIVFPLWTGILFYKNPFTPNQISVSYYPFWHWKWFKADPPWRRSMDSLLLLIFSAASPSCAERPQIHHNLFLNTCSPHKNDKRKKGFLKGQQGLKLWV